MTTTRYIVESGSGKQYWNTYGTGWTAAEMEGREGNTARLYRDNADGVVLLKVFGDGAAS